MDPGSRSDPEAKHMGEANPRAFNLPGTSLAAQLIDDLDHVGDTGRADRVALGQEPARHVDRNPPAQRGIA